LNDVWVDTINNNSLKTDEKVKNLTASWLKLDKFWVDIKESIEKAIKERKPDFELTPEHKKQMTKWFKDLTALTDDPKADLANLELFYKFPRYLCLFCRTIEPLIKYTITQ
jgi:hypothetical protein